MQYRHRPLIYNRRYMNLNNGYKAGYEKSEPITASISADTLKNIEDIPLPNEIEVETPPPSTHGVSGSRGSSPLDFIKSRIHIDDIILIGLLFLILDDGFDDDFFLIVLLYILLF